MCIRGTNCCRVSLTVGISRPLSAAFWLIVHVVATEKHFGERNPSNRLFMGCDATLCTSREPEKERECLCCCVIHVFTLPLHLYHQLFRRIRHILSEIAS